MPKVTHPDSVIHSSRVLSARPTEVFAAFEDPDKLAIWWGPDGFTNTFSIFEFVPDGKWVFTMRAPNGNNHANESIFREIIRGSRIVIEHIVQPWFRLTVTFTADGEQTRFDWEQEFESPEVAAKVRSFAGPANEQVLDRLAAVLAKN